MRVQQHGVFLMLATLLQPGRHTLLMLLLAVDVDVVQVVVAEDGNQVDRRSLQRRLHPSLTPPSLSLMTSSKPPPRPCTVCGEMHWEKCCPVIALAKKTYSADKAVHVVFSTVSVNMEGVILKTSAVGSPIILGEKGSVMLSSSEPDSIDILLDKSSSNICILRYGSSLRPPSSRFSNVYLRYLI